MLFRISVEFRQDDHDLAQRVVMHQDYQTHREAEGMLTGYRQMVEGLGYAGRGGHTYVAHWGNEHTYFFEGPQGQQAQIRLRHQEPD